MSINALVERLLLRGIAFSAMLGSFYKVRTRDERVLALKDHLELLMAKHPPRDVTGDGVPETFCNIALHETGRLFGFHGFGGLLANAIVARLVIDAFPEFKRASAADAVAAAKDGRWALAGKAYSPHGHVATIYPAEMLFSASLGRLVPLVANVGKTNGVMRVSMAFPPSHGEPSYWLYAGKSQEE